MRQEVIELLLENSLIPREITKSLLEIPLILLTDALPQNPAIINQALDAWMKQAQESDKQLKFKRPYIPYAAVYIPDTPNSLDFFNLAKAIGEIAYPYLTPDNHNQAGWMKTMHYYWQAQGVLLAYKIFGVIPNPVAPNGVLSRYLPDTSVKNLKLSTEIHLACYHLIHQGESQIKAWAAAEGKPYNFSTPTDLFLEILQQEFSTHLLLCPLSLETQWLDKHTQRENLSARIRLLAKNPWSEKKHKKRKFPEIQPKVSALRPRSLSYQEAEGQYLKFLKQSDWYGGWLLALREHDPWGPLAPLWENYLQALRAGKDLFIDEFDWRAGHPYKAYSTSRSCPVEAGFDSEGHICWFWS